jgi:hypothetical protein
VSFFLMVRVCLGVAVKSFYIVSSLARAVSASCLGQGQISTKLSLGLIKAQSSNTAFNMPLGNDSVVDIKRPRAMTFSEFSSGQSKESCDRSEGEAGKIVVSHEVLGPVADVRISHIDPALLSNESKETARLALLQTFDARNLLYVPGHALKEELGEAAYTLHSLIMELGPDDQQALGARLFGKEGLLSGENPSVLLGALARVRDDYQLPGKSNNTTGLDRTVVIALMGDIGALYADTGATTGVEGRSQMQADTLRENLRNLIEKYGLSGPTYKVIRDVQRAGGSSVVGPLKKEERTRPPAELTLRSGIHNAGEKADIQLNIALNQRIPGAKWDVAHISKNRVVATTEPLVGHMSGSPAEILQVWDMLRGDGHEMQFLGALNKRDPNHWDPLINVSLERQDQQLARVAGTAAFLVGLGYHSAVEIAEGVFTYMGQNLRAALGDPKEDAGHLLGHGAATSLMSELFKEQSAASEFSQLT